MTTMSDFTGVAASTLVLLTFLTKDMRLLRILGIFSNLAFIAYGAIGWLWPIFCLHMLLLPLNVVRLIELQGMDWKPRNRLSARPEPSLTARLWISSRAPMRRPAVWG
jgi:hypothetical protein